MLVGGVLMWFVLYHRTSGDHAHGCAMNLSPTFQIAMFLN
jgi:hypothetical protein